MNLGERFTHMTVIGPAGGMGKVACRCDCGAEKFVRMADLRRQRTRACGRCRYTTGMTVTAKGTHGEGGQRYSKEYTAWKAMIQRCTDPKFIHYANYGGRGISVCERWSTFDTFLSDMGRKPTPGHSLDRIDVDGPYEPINCRWATRKEQNRNTRRTAWVLYQGEMMALSEACERAGVSKSRGERMFERFALIPIRAAAVERKAQ